MSFNAYDEATKLMSGHPGVAMATADTAVNTGILQTLLQLLFSSGLNIPAILALGAKLVPLIIAKDWAGIFKVIADYFTNPTPAPANPDITVV